MGYNIVLSTSKSTVVTEYTSDRDRSSEYQSEAALESSFLKQLENQSYEKVNVRNEEELILNLRKQLELLNKIEFSDDEWKRFFIQNLASPNEGVVEKTKKMQSDHVQILIRDDGSTKNITLIDKNNIHNNRLQVLNQYEEDRGTHKTRYDVTILVNGFPLIHVELKRRGIPIREAFNQIKRYQRDSFWAGSGLYDYVQIFVISNGTHTKYYSNTTREQHLKESTDSRSGKSKKTSHSFEFTSYWADANNKTIPDLVDFTKTFFAKHTILNILTRYCVLTSENLLLVMRPYQIVATERILNRIEVATNYRKTGTLEAGGYIWHTTGSGKTLTSFKAAQLATQLSAVDKVLFVVDRKDLDYQTMKEYEKFQKGAANSNTSTRVLQRQLENSNAKIIITTIQKLDRFIVSNKNHPIYKQHTVIIFDECHRSQFGDMHERITKSFKNYHLFGFTGTPIFAANAGSSGNPLKRTTEQVFGDKLHTYTIVDAINDGNVLPFRIDFINTIREKPEIEDKKVSAINVERALMAPERISSITEYILDHFDQKTKRSSFYSLKGKRMAGFNSIFAVASIPMAMKYYMEFQKQIEKKNSGLRIATIYSYSVNEDDPDDALPDEGFETDRLDQTSRDFLEQAIIDYNKQFNTNFSTSSNQFENYYKDISQRVKDREIDLLIVVNMFLTGFDATTLNTLWVDKNLRQHGLIQAFSRTNRILNSVKTFGNIICFRDLKDATDDAIALFGDKDAGGIILMRTFDEYYYGYEDKGVHHPGYVELINSLKEMFPLGQPIIGEEAQREFIKLFGSILRSRNILTAFDDFTGLELITERDLQDYQSVYLDLHQELKSDQDADKENINEDIVFELELIRQIEVNIDYILMLVTKYKDSNCEDKSILTTIDKAVSSSIELRSKKELIEGFLDRVNHATEVEDEWQTFVKKQQKYDLSKIIEDERLKVAETERYVYGSFRDGALKTSGTDLDNILPPVSRFGGSNRNLKKQTVTDKLMEFFEKYFGLM